MAFQHQQLICLWSNGLLEAYSMTSSTAVNTASSTTSAAAAGPASSDTVLVNSLKLKFSKQLVGFAAALGKVSSEQPTQKQQTPKESQEPKTGKKRRKPATPLDIVQSAAHDSPPSAFQPALVALGGHSVAAIREITEGPSNGHQTSALEATVLDTMYGCVQSVTTVQLPKVANSIASDGASAATAAGLPPVRHQQVLQLGSGMGNLVILAHDAVWSTSIQVILSSFVHAIHTFRTLQGAQKYLYFYV